MTFFPTGSRFSFFLSYYFFFFWIFKHWVASFFVFTVSRVVPLRGFSSFLFGLCACWCVFSYIIKFYDGKIDTLVFFLFCASWILTIFPRNRQVGFLWGFNVGSLEVSKMMNISLKTSQHSSFNLQRKRFLYQMKKIIIY